MHVLLFVIYFISSPYLYIEVSIPAHSFSVFVCLFVCFLPVPTMYLSFRLTCTTVYIFNIIDRFQGRYFVIFLRLPLSKKSIIQEKYCRCVVNCSSFPRTVLLINSKNYKMCLLYRKESKLFKPPHNPGSVARCKIQP